MAESELPPWLTRQPVNALGSIAQGVQTGAALAGVINQRDLTQSRLRLEEQDHQINHLKIEKAIRDRDNVLEADFIMQEVPDRIAPLLAAGKPNDARNVLLSLAARKPAVLYSETYPKLLQEVDAAVATEDKRLQLQSNEALRAAQIKEIGMRSAKEEAQAYSIGLGEGKQFSPPREAKLAALLRQATEDGDTHMIGVYTAALDSETKKQTNATTRIEQSTHRLDNADTKLALGLKVEGYQSTKNPDGTVTLTPTARPPTTGEATKAQDEIATSLTALGHLDSTLQDLTLHPEAAGLRGKIFSFAEKVKGTLNPNLPAESATITGIQRSLGQAEQEIFNATRGGIRTSQWELSKLAGAGSLTGALDAPNIAKKTLTQFKDLVAGNTIRRMNELHQSISDEVLMKVSSPSELADMNKNGIPISKALVLRYLQLHPEFDPVTGMPR